MGEVAEHSDAAQHARAGDRDPAHSEVDVPCGEN
jgi:hypothetical protein